MKSTGQEPPSGSIRITRAKLKAADYLYRRMKGWVLIDSTLDHMRERDPSNLEIEVVDAKVLTINTLYRTRLLATRQMARHIVKQMQKTEHTDAGLVEAISKIRFKEKAYRLISFASKYCHFFVDPERYSVFDSYNVRALKLHLGDRGYTIRALSTDYGVFLKSLERLVKRDSLEVSWRELDHYLYLWGLWRDYVDPQKRRQIAEGIRELFEMRNEDERINSALEIINSR